MKRYEEYVQTGVEWMPQIPLNWGIKRFKFVATSQKGRNPSELFESAVEASHVPYLAMDYLRGNHKQVFYASTKDANNIQIEEGDLLLLWDGSNSGEFVVGKKGILSSTMGKIVPILEIDKQYFFHFAKFFERILKQGTIGMGIPHVNPSILNNGSVPLPSLFEQRDIARFLDYKTAQIDQLITQKQQMLALLQEERASLINHAVTRGLDFDAPVRDSGIEWLGEVPAHWDVKKLKYLIRSTKGGGTPSTENPDFWNGSIPWVSPKDMKVDFISASQDYITDFAVENSSVVRIEPNSILMVVRSGILKHTLPVAINTVPVTLNQDMKAFVPVDGIDVRYFSQLLKGLEPEILTFCTKIGATVDSMEMEYLLNFEVPIPPSEEQMRLCDHISKGKDRIEKAVSTITMEIDLLQEYRSALIAEAVSGQIDVRNYEPALSLTAEFVG